MVIPDVRDWSDVREISAQIVRKQKAIEFLPNGLSVARHSDRTWKDTSRTTSRVERL